MSQWRTAAVWLYISAMIAVLLIIDPPNWVFSFLVGWILPVMAFERGWPLTRRMQRALAGTAIVTVGSQFVEVTLERQDDATAWFGVPLIFVIMLAMVIWAFSAPPAAAERQPESH